MINSSTTSTFYTYLSGASANNISRYGLSSFDNIGYVLEGRNKQISYTNLCIQARIGDIIRLKINVVTRTTQTNVRIRIFVNYNTSYTLVNTIDYYEVNVSNVTSTYDYNIPSTATSGVHVILIMVDDKDYNTVYRTENYYTLQIF